MIRYCRRSSPPEPQQFPHPRRLSLQQRKLPDRSLAANSFHSLTLTAERGLRLGMRVGQSQPELPDNLSQNCRTISARTAGQSQPELLDNLSQNCRTISARTAGQSCQNFNRIYITEVVPGPDWPSRGVSKQRGAAQRAAAARRDYHY